ncbi:hypothetical protein CHS0354_021604 [Potamilus streckersoni]|uniref:Alpha-(1,6)-fucosyltransferase n=1 Tax=Potamilus streckersoni TaxID=2493646 RepID=A0AAE0SP20_9BIVA|nr:hypothetical protein CHS0354_021604 [Potamilus streckersoni]
MRYWKAVTGLLVLWLCIIVYMSNTVFPNGSSDTNVRTERQLHRALEELSKLKLQNEELHKLANELKDIKFTAGKNQVTGEEKGQVVEMLQERLDKATKELKQLSANTLKLGQSYIGTGKSTGEPSMNHEIVRRKVENDMQEFWLFVKSELNKMKGLSAGNGNLLSKINSLLANSAGFHRTLTNDLKSLSSMDGMEDWRNNESRELGELIQRRFHYIQNPADCSKAKKIVCNLGKGCGYGCQLHHVTYCLMMAYANKRTLILESKGWRYATGGWESVFQPLSNTCNSYNSFSLRSWGGMIAKDLKDVQVIELPIIDSLHPRPEYLPLAIPDDIGDRLIRLHGDPSVWWIGQFVKYLTRPQQHLVDEIERTKRNLGFKNPIVGVHVRRTDKVGMEAAFHGIEEYMAYVVEWFDILEARQSVKKRRVYLASDDPTVLLDARKLYPNYEFISDNEISKSAGLNSRYSDASLRGVIIDIHFLSLCNYLVCTFSSQVCRVAYEMMQTMHGDASSYFKSLDDIYYFGGQNAHNMEVIESNVPRDDSEIELQPKDLIGIAGNHWDGYSKGINRRTGKNGLFPSYKVQNKVLRAKLPTYEEVEYHR